MTNHLIYPFSKTHEEIVWLYISMQERLGMNKLNTVDLRK
jgi:hypothetical protein